jgi:predicted enzyme related to lactoylglutathione lyase
MMKRQSAQQQGITNYFDVKSVQEYSTKVEKLEAKLYPQKSWCQALVILLLCTDTENNSFGIFEADDTAK